MKKAIKYLTFSIALVFLVFTLGVYLWYNHLEYYWHSVTFKLYQKDGIIRLCNGEIPVSPSWSPSPENMRLISLGESYIKENLPITIYGRGGVSESTSEVFVNEIHKVESGVNPSCEAAL